MNIKEKVLSDRKFASALEYIFTKEYFSNSTEELKFIYKKHKIILSRIGRYGVYKFNGQKLYGNIIFQEVAKYIVDNISNPSLCNTMLNLEKELIRIKENIKFQLNLNNKLKREYLEDCVSYQYSRFSLLKNSILDLLKRNSLHLIEHNPYY